MQTVNCISSQLLNDGYEMTDTILNITGKSWLRAGEGIKEKCCMLMLFKAYILLYSSTCSFGRLCVMFWEIQFLNSEMYLKRLLYNLFTKNFHLCSQKQHTLPESGRTCQSERILHPHKAPTWVCPMQKTRYQLSTSQSWGGKSVLADAHFSLA